MLERLGLAREEATACGCDHSIQGTILRVDASACPGGGDLADRPACRHTVVDALGAVTAERIRVEVDGVVRWYLGDAAALLSAAGRFAARIDRRDSRLAATSRRDPIGAAQTAVARAGLVNDVAVETGLDAFADTPADYEEVLAPLLSPAITASLIDPAPPAGGHLRTSRVLDSGATVRIYETPDQPPVYHLEPLEYTFDDGAAATLREARDEMVAAGPDGGISTPLAAVDAVAGEDCPVDTFARVLEKHTNGLGVFEDLFSDSAIDEVFVNAPAEATRLHVRVGDTEMRTNVRITGEGVSRLAATVRTESGRAFSRASPTIDTALSDVGTTPVLRVSGVREPASDGLAFALRAEGTDDWRLSRLVSLGTITPDAAGLLSVAMTRGTAVLIAGSRGAGKTTMAAALLWELGAGTRVLAIEDTPELPIRALQAAGRDAQRLEAAADFEADVDLATALRTALRFGDGALAIGEVRGEEAGVLYEAMRVGAASDTVIGTIHGEGYEGVKERVVSDLGVPESSFAATDLLVTLAPVADGKQVTTIEEVTETGGATLFEYRDGSLDIRPRVERGNSQLVATLTHPDETYADTLATIEERADRFRGWRGSESDRPEGNRSDQSPHATELEGVAHG